MFVCIALAAAALGGCAPRHTGNGALEVVAAENVWGSVAAELGGERVRVRSILTDPNADPHEFESDVATARAVADARYVVINGLGYDAWAERLLSAGHGGSRDVLVAGDVVGKRRGDNAHVWYDPAYVARIADRISADLARIDPPGAAYYRERRARFERACRPYRDRLASIRRRFAGRPVGATESIVVYVTAAAGLRLTTPSALLDAVNNGTEPPASSVYAFHRQIDARAIDVLLDNTQTATAVTHGLREAARARGIPVVAVTETVVPPNGRFEDWQLAEASALEAALAR